LPWLRSTRRGGAKATAKVTSRSAGTCPARTPCTSRAPRPVMSALKVWTDAEVCQGRVRYGSSVKLRLAWMPVCHSLDEPAQRTRATRSADERKPPQSLCPRCWSYCCCDHKLHHVPSVTVMTTPVGLCDQLVPLTPATVMPYIREDGTDVRRKGRLHNGWPRSEPALTG